MLDNGEIKEIILLNRKSNRFGEIWYKLTKFSSGWIRIEYGNQQEKHCRGDFLSDKTMRGRARQKIKKGYKIHTHIIIEEI